MTCKRSFFILSSQDELHQTIAGNIFLHGLITFAPQIGLSNEFKIFWDASIISPPIDKAKLCTVIFKEEVDHIIELKLFRGPLIRIIQMDLALVHSLSKHFRRNTEMPKKNLKNSNPNKKTDDSGEAVRHTIQESLYVLNSLSITSL